jgi:AcrR family transcriptional regulator
MVKIRSAAIGTVKPGMGSRGKSRPGAKRLRLVQEAGAEEQTRERIIRVATALFYERGYRGTSLAAIARQVGISAPALYWHFSSKREVCFTAVYEELNRFVQSLKAAAQGPSPPAQLARFVRSYVLLKLKQNEWLREPGAAGTYRQLHQALTQSQKERVNALQRQAFDLLRAILADGSQAGTFTFDDLTATTFAVITLCEYVFAWVRPGGRLTPDAVADIYQRLVLTMVGAKAS